MGEFKDVLRDLRKASGLKQYELAKKLDISRSAIGMYETGSRKPMQDDLEKIADFFNVDIDYLLGRTNKTTMHPKSVLREDEKHVLSMYNSLTPENQSRLIQLLHGMGMMQEADDIIALVEEKDGENLA